MAEKFDFNHGLEELEKIVKKMESGELGLQESLSQFERGIKLTRQCENALEKAKQKVTLLTKGDSQETYKKK